MKKKILAVAIAAIMIVTAIASMSLAYMTDTDEQKNTMTVGKVDIEQLEYEGFPTSEAEYAADMVGY